MHGNYLDHQVAELPTRLSEDFIDADVDDPRAAHRTRHHRHQLTTPQAAPTNARSSHPQQRRPS
jgi:hypothetical protein